MSKEFQIRDGNLIASFDLENEDGDIDFCKLLKVSHGVADEIGMFVDYVATNKIIKDQSKQIADLESKLAESEEQLKEELVEKKGLERALSACNRQNDEFADMIKKLVNEKEELKQQLEEKEKENKTLKDIRTLERVVPRNAQLNKLSNRDCYLKGFENAISETIRTFEETYGKEKCKLIEERDKYLMDIVKVGGYEYQIEELKQQLAEKEKEKEKEKSLSIKSVVRTLMKDNNLNCTFRDKTNAQIQQCGDVYNSNYGYFNFEDDYDESLNNKNDNRFDITSIDLTNQDKISFCIEQLEKVKEFCNNPKNRVEYEYCPNAWTYAVDKDKLMLEIDNQIKQLKEGK